MQGTGGGIWSTHLAPSWHGGRRRGGFVKHFLQAFPVVRCWNPSRSFLDLSSGARLVRLHTRDFGVQSDFEVSVDRPVDIMSILKEMQVVTRFDKPENLTPRSHNLARNGGGFYKVLSIVKLHTGAPPYWNSYW